jgi:hypothetical protein
LVEASLDAFYSLSPVPRLLAEKEIEIESALKGSMENDLVISSELEDRLIHFIYGRKVAKADSSMTPESHFALEPKEYRNAAGFPDAEREDFRKLYDDLCGICHPTALSLAFLWDSSEVLPCAFGIPQEILGTLGETGAGSPQDNGVHRFRVP